MQIFLYIICALSCMQTIDGLWFDDGDDHEFTSFLSTRSSAPLSTTRILDSHEEITDAKVFACSKLYESELNGKSQQELNQLLKECFDQPDYDRPLYRQKAIALLFGGAQAESTRNETPLRNAILFDDIPFAHYICTHCHENPNQIHSFVPLWFSCKSTAMAQLLIRHGADMTAKPTFLFSGNILHYLNPENTQSPALIQLYYSMHPPLIHETDEAGRTPLVKYYNVVTIGGTYITSSVLSCVYILVNLGADTNIAPLKLPIDDKSLFTKQKEILRNLVTYIQNPPKIHSSLFEQLWDQWHDKTD